MREFIRALPVVVLFSACVIGDEVEDSTIESTLGGAANVTLSGSSAHVTLASDTAWTLDKSGSLSGDTVTWNIVATKGATMSGRLVVQGHVTIKNTGQAPAPIGNIVVNLQKQLKAQSGKGKHDGTCKHDHADKKDDKGNKGNNGNNGNNGNKGNNGKHKSKDKGKGKDQDKESGWVTISSDIANATDGDDATSAKIHEQASSEGKGAFFENSASGELRLWDASNNSIISLAPHVEIGPKETRTLLFQASFDNNELELTKGTKIRVEVIVSVGNAGNGNSTAKLDIDGNGSIDSYEKRVRSVSTRLVLTVPAQTNSNSKVTLLDTLDDITTTGTVTFSNVQFDLGSTSGTVTATVDGGSDGGTITNCARLEGAGTTASSGGNVFPVINGVDLTACSTVDVGASSCEPGEPGCDWAIGDQHSLGQFNWDSSAGGAPLLTANYTTVYAATAGVLTVGVISPTAYSMSFTTVTALRDYLPAIGPVGPLTSDVVNPTTTASGEFGGDVVALKLNIDFSDAGLLEHTGPAFGDLLLCDVTPSALNGTNIRNLLAAANTLLSGQPSSLPLAQVAQLVRDVNLAFAGGVPDTFAQQHVFVNRCP